MSSENRVPDVFIVGPRWPQHCTFSGYDGFHRFVGEYLPPPVSSRWPWANNAMQRVVPRPRYLLSEVASWVLTKISGRTYSWPIMRIEMAAARHMFRRRGAVYHVIYGETDFWFLGRVARWTGNHLVVSFHDGEKVLRGHGIDRHLMKQVDAVMILGETQRPFFETLMSSDKIHVIPHGVDPEYFRPDESVAKRRMVITVGGHTRDYETFARAIALVWDVDPAVRFVAVSPNIGHLGEPFEMDGVEFYSGISDDELLRLYQSSAVAAFSFEWAIANNAVLEAMACGLPIVATDIGGVHEYVPNGAGTLFPSGESASMAKAILEFLDDEDLAAHAGRVAREWAIGLSYDKVARDMEDVYAKVAASERR